jgi:hypothetical protein
VLLGQRTGPDGCSIRTLLYFHRPAAARIWKVVRPIHKAVALYLLRRAALAR